MSSGGSLPGPGVSFVCSWSGGKDSCLALHRAIGAGARPAYLLSMLREDGERSRSHGLRTSVLQAQAAALGVPLITRRASWSEYENVFVTAVQELRAEGVEAGVFGDIDIDDHRLWEEKVCAAAGLTAHLPLWKMPRLDLLSEITTSGHEAMIVACNSERMGRNFLGRSLEPDLICEFEQLGIDLAGEQGEYHTVVTGGPRFSRPLRLVRGAETLHSGYWFLDMSPQAEE